MCPARGLLYTFFMDCPFCTIEKNERSRILFQGKSVFVIFSNPRLVPGHLLVIPKRHVLKLQELSRDEQKELFDTALLWQEQIIKKLAPGCDIRQNYRPFIQQNNLKIDHAHVHLIPRGSEDELYQKSMKYEKEIFAPLSQEEVESTLQTFQQ